MNSWKKASGEAFHKLADLKQLVPGYSYESQEYSLATDEQLCAFITTSLSTAKRLLYNISDLLFSLQLGEGLLDKIQNMRIEVDILSDEIKIRHCEWREIPPEFLLKIIKHDHSLTEKAHQLNLDIELLFNGILTETKRSRHNKRYHLPKHFWSTVDKGLDQIRLDTKELAILFKEREVMCNIHPITLERTFQALREEIRNEV